MPDNTFLMNMDDDAESFVIPGSSLKGALRHVARAISDGYITSSDRNLRIREVEEFRQENRARPYDE